MRIYWKAFIDFLSKVFAWPATGAVIPFVSICIGLAWGAWKDEITSTFLVFAAPGAPNASPHATLFWLLCLTLLVLGIANQWAKDHDSKRNKRELQERLDGLGQQSKELSAAINRVHSLPPAGVLEDCRQMYERCEAYYDFANRMDLTAATARAALEELIRKYLSMVSRFVRTFDGEHLQSSAVRYGLNIMLFVPKADYDGKPRKDEIAARLRFALNAQTLDSSVGVLDIVPALSIVGGTQGIDDQLASFAVPIAVAARFAPDEESEQAALPGAARAFINVKHLAYGSVERLEHDMNKRSTDKTVQAQMLGYFAEPAIHRTVRSFVCVPLIASETGVLGVLNIHRDTPNREIEDRLAMFIPLIAPVRHQLARLLLKYKPLHLSP